jgi:hypothetical protein
VKAAGKSVGDPCAGQEQPIELLPSSGKNPFGVSRDSQGDPVIHFSRETLGPDTHWARAGKV